MKRIVAAGSAFGFFLLLAAPAWASTYTVRSGDTLSAIAVRNRISVSTLISWNHLQGGNLIRPGQRLVVAPAGGLSAATYRVQSGDTLSGIAARFGIAVGQLQAANAIANPRLLHVGSLLVLPGAGAGTNLPASASAPAASGVYVIRPGDTLSGIAVRFHLSATTLARQSGITNPNHVVVGQRLLLTAPTAPAAAAPAVASRGGSVVVQPGDTLSGIAVQTGTSLSALMSINGITNSGRVIAGQRLILPLGQGSAPVSASASPVGLALLQAAERYQGVPYVWGGASPAGFDCSGLIQYAGRQVGLSLPRDSWDQYNVGTPVAESDLQPGDLLFFQTYAPGASHVGIYAGNGQMFAAASEWHQVTFVNFRSSFFQSHFLGARRLG